MKTEEEIIQKIKYLKTLARNMSPYTLLTEEGRREYLTITGGVEYLHWVLEV